MSPPEMLRTTIGDFTLEEFRLRLGGREWGMLHTGAVLSRDDETRMLEGVLDCLPYGVALWPASIALAHDVAARGEAIAGKRVLELGAGTGLPGIVAASFGAKVVQTERNEVAMSICRRNAERNRVTDIDHRLADWTAWEDPERYDLILGSDILYGPAFHPALRAIFEGNLAPGGRVLLADPFREPSLRLLEEMEGDGWRIALTKWTVEGEGAPRPIGVFEMGAPE
jgi:methyltransferase-like protein 23